MRTTLVILHLVLLTVACSDGADPPFGPDAGATDALASVDGQCGPNLKAYGPACVPIFDDCKDDEVPLPGGGCKKVGVEECLGGWGIKGPPDWQCKSIGVKECDPEWGLSWGPDWKCESIGPPRKCKPGPTPFSAPVCQPIMPERVCPDGFLPVVGSGTCEPIQDCGEGVYGRFGQMPGALFVHAGYEGRESDGSKERPYRRIGDALEAVEQGGTIVVGDGSYEEALRIHKSVNILGRCPQRVKIAVDAPDEKPTIDDIWRWRHSPAFARPILVDHGAVVFVRGVRISGKANGVLVRDEHTALILDSCEVTGCEVGGVAVAFGARLTIRHSHLRRNGELGLYVSDARALVEDSAITDGKSTLRPDGTVAGGWGVFLRRDQQETSATIKRSLLLRNRGSGIIGVAADLTVEDSIIADTREHEGLLQEGSGISLRCLGEETTLGYLCDAESPQTHLTLRRSLLMRNRFAGLDLRGASATIWRSVIKDTVEHGFDGGAVGGIFAAALLKADHAGVVIEESLIARNRHGGVNSYGIDLRIERSIVRDTQYSRRGEAYGGRGVTAYTQYGQEASLTVRDCLISGNHLYGVDLTGANGSIERSLITDNIAGIPGLGTGVDCASWLGFPAELTLADSILARNASGGLALSGCNAEAERVIIRDSSNAPMGQEGDGIVLMPAVNWDAQGNVIVDAEGDYFDFARSSHLVLRDALISGNSRSGITLKFASAEVERTIVRDTKASDFFGDGLEFGVGVFVGNSSKTVRSKLSFRESIVANNEGAGMHLLDVDTTLQNVVVRGTLPNPGDGRWGGGVQAFSLERPSSLQVEDCLVEDSRLFGVAAWGADAHVARSLIRMTHAGISLKSTETTLEERDTVGDGVVGLSTFTLMGGADGLVEYSAGGSLVLEDSLLESSARVGLFVKEMPAKARRSVFRDNVIPVYYDETSPDLGQSNVYEQNEQNEPATGLGLEAAPAPYIPDGP